VYSKSAEAEKVKLPDDFSGKSGLKINGNEKNKTQKKKWVITVLIFTPE
jgi:hypothetical protein